MNYKTYYRNKFSIDSAICTKSKLIFLATIVFLFTATVSFAADQIELPIDCKTEKTKNITISPGTEQVRIDFTNCCCMKSEIKKGREDYCAHKT